jgi:hypothetical protein
VPTSIRHILEKLKYFIADEGLYTAFLLILVAMASFGLGRQSIIESESLKSVENKSSVVLTESSKITSNLAPTPLQNSYKEESESELVGEVNGEVVASKSGTKYHLPTCSGAKNIKPENIITFSSREEAEAAGYTPAANCKGLQE